MAIGLMVALLAAAALSLGMGSVVIPPSEVLGVFAHRIGLSIGADPSELAESVLWSIRFPRVLMGVVVGGGLALAGVVLQGVFRNPMADPQLLGISAGASLGAVIGSAASGTGAAIVSGAAAGLLTALVIRRLGQYQADHPTRFVLTGVALSVALSAWVGFVVFGADRNQVPPIEFWLLGSLSGSTWRALWIAGGLVGLGGIVVVAAARTLDLMALGESNARHLGVDVESVTTVLLIVTGTVVGATVGAVGVIGFVGLTVPHLMRFLTGPSHRPLMTASCLAGGLTVVLADLASRTVIAPVEIPVGLVTAAVGGPFFLWLIRPVKA